MDTSEKKHHWIQSVKIRPQANQVLPSSGYDEASCFRSEWMVNQHLSLDESATLSLSQSAKTKENNFHKTYIASCKSNMHMPRACVFLIEIMDSFPPTMFVQQRVVPSSVDMACWLCGKLHVTQLQTIFNSIYTLSLNATSG